MDIALKARFLERWEKYFAGAPFPLGFFYSDSEVCEQHLHPAKGHVCVVCQLTIARKGKTFCVERESIGCFGGRRYLGFSTDLMPDFDYFLSCGIPGQLEGERYKRTPELVRELVHQAPTFTAPARYGVFKRRDTLEAHDEPQVVIFFATPDVLAGLFTLANFDEPEPHGVIAPFAAGCGTIVQYPWLEKDRARPRAVLGNFDVSARPCLDAGELSFAVPISKFRGMVEQMDESFLITASWEKVKRRIRAATNET